MFLIYFKRKIFLFLLVVVILLGCFYSLTYYGPVRLSIETDDGLIFDDFFTVYGAANYKMEGSSVLYRRERIVSNRDVINISTNIRAFFPSYFFVAVCHPLYQCGVSNIERKDVKGEINFGGVTMYSWLSRLESNKGSAVKLDFIFKMILTDIEINYMPYIKKNNHKVNAKYYSGKIHELCTMAYKKSPDLLLRRCSLSRFEDMFAYVD